MMSAGDGNALRTVFFMGIVVVLVWMVVVSAPSTRHKEELLEPPMAARSVSFCRP